MAKTNCYKCGTRIEDEEITQRKVNGRMRDVCNEDYLNCEPHPDDMEIPDDTPSLDVPWWHYR